MRVLAFGTYDAAAHPRVAALVEGLREHGVQVDECNVPLGLSTADKVGILTRPWRVPLLLGRIARCWLRLIRMSRRFSRPDAVLVGYLGHFDVHLARRLYPKQVLVLDHLIGASDTAKDRRVSGGVRQRLLRAIDAAALRAADVVVVDTEEHLGALPERRRAKGVVVPVGAPHTWFEAARAPDDVSPDGLTAVFFGLYTPLQGAPVIGAALAQLAGSVQLAGSAQLAGPRIHVTMIGTGQDLAETRAAAGAGATWLDWVPSDDLPALVAGHDVCLGIFGTGDKARRVVPNKVFQGLAAGCAVITSDTEPQRRALGDAAVLVPPGDADALAAALRRLAGDRAALVALRAAAGDRARAAFTAGAVVAPLTDRLHDLVDHERVPQ